MLGQTFYIIRQLAKATALQLNIVEREKVTSNTMTIRGFAFQFESEICVQYRWKSDVAPGGSSATLLHFCIH